MPAFRFLLDHANHLVGAGHADIEVAIGAQHDSVGAAFDEVVSRNLVGQLQTLATVGAAAGLQAVQALE